MKNYIFLSLFFYSSVALAQQKQDEPNKFFEKLSSSFEYSSPLSSSDTSSNPVYSNWFSGTLAYETSDNFLVGLGWQVP